MDDFRPREPDGAATDYSRLGTWRSPFGAGTSLQDDAAYVDATEETGGFVTELGDPNRGEGLDPFRPLGPFVKDGWQPWLVGLRVEVEAAWGSLEVALLDGAGDAIWSAEVEVNSRSRSLDLPLELDEGVRLRQLQWRYPEGSFGAVRRVSLLMGSPGYADPIERAFLYAYGQLSRCYDPETGLVAWRGRYPAADYAAVEGSGLFALATAVAWDLGYVSSERARAVAERIRERYLHETPIDPLSGLMPRHVARGEPAEESYWSSLHTVLGLEAAILAAQATGLYTGDLEALLEGIDWSLLTRAHEDPIAAGLDLDGELLSWDLGTFGSEAVLVSVAYAATQVSAQPPMGLPYAPTWDGSGYRDELAELLFPMSGIDAWGNSWQGYREGAFWTQYGWFADHSYGASGLFGLSTADTPEPWLTDEGTTSGDWGVGGHNQRGDDGSALTGYPILAPYYVAMVSAEHPNEAEGTLGWLMDVGVLGPLNAVESFGIDYSGQLRWSHALDSAHLAMMALGAGRALSGSSYLPHRALEDNPWLSAAFTRSMTRE